MFRTAKKNSEEKLDEHLNQKRDFVSIAEYESVIRENEKLKCFIAQLKSLIENAS